MERGNDGSLRVLICGGGTGGHVVPALAIGRELRDHHGAAVEYVGTPRGLETRLVPEAGFPLHLVRSGQLKNVSLAVRAKTAFDVPRGVAHCVGLIRRFRPHVVVGVGGYASGPGMLAALISRTPTLVYEPNAVPGLTNRMVGRRVSAAAVHYPETAKFFRRATVTGVPVREAIFAVPPLTGAETPRLLITAGSQGAKVFNDTLPEIANRLLELVPGLAIVHQAGPRHLEATQAAYTSAAVNPARVAVSAFLDDMPQQLGEATVVLARSGSTVAELAAAGRPSLLVPFPQSADDHQRRNAEVMQRAGAANLLLQQDASPERLLSELLGLLTAPELLARMGASARALARPDALQRIAGMTVQLAHGR